MIDRGVRELVGDDSVTDGAVSPCSVERDSVTQSDSFDLGSRSGGRLPLCGARFVNLYSFSSLGIFLNFFFFLFR